MPSAVITVENLSKRYTLSHKRAGDEGLRHAIQNLATAPFRGLAKKSPAQSPAAEDFWALRDVSFEVQRGEVVGVIGVNGAGKSTLLKILSRITEPTSGRVCLDGRVASLLEVGTGFHPELTGRENIFINGAILGMTKQEVKTKFDEIVDFAEVERFLDTPVKRYSSGMYVRLAFAVAAHLEPEILIVDEVLAVGDTAFQKKCLGKIQDVAQGGRTVIFVSHNMPAIIGLTSRAVMLEGGCLVRAGASKDVVSCFLRSMQKKIQVTGDLSAYRRIFRAEGYAEIRTIKVCGEEPGRASISIGEQVVIEIGLDVLRQIEREIVVINILNEQMEVLTSIISTDKAFDIALAPGYHTLLCTIGSLPLIPGDYRLSVGIAPFHGALAWDVLEPVPGFRIQAKPDKVGLPYFDRPGVLLLNDCQWRKK